MDRLVWPPGAARETTIPRGLGSDFFFLLENFFTFGPDGAGQQVGTATPREFSQFSQFAPLGAFSSRIG